MDRRRYVPQAEGLEGRQLMATNVAGLSTIAERAQRIERLPFYMAAIQPGRVLPKATIEAIQDDLAGLLGRIRRPNPDTLVAFNLQMRSTLAHLSLRSADAAGLNATFRQVLVSAQTPTELVSSLSANMNDLARSDSGGRNPTYLTSNDYALVLQVVLGIGRPLAAPAAPKLAAADNTGSKNDSVTRNRQPALVGTYQPGVVIRIIGQNGAILGAAATRASGKYTVKFAQPLPIGKQTFRVNALDDNGAVSLSSRPFTITIQG